MHHANLEAFNAMRRLDRTPPVDTLIDDKVKVSISTMIKKTPCTYRDF